MKKDLIKLLAIGLVLFLSGFTLRSIGIAESAAEAATDQAIEVSYQMNDGFLLYAWLYDADPANEKPGLALLLPMMGHTHDSYENFISLLKTNGYAALAFDLRGHGKSVKAGSRTFAYEDMTPDEFALIPEDINSFFGNFKKENPRRFDYDNIVVIGASIGANTAGLLLDENWLTRAVLLSPGKDYRSLEPGLVMAVSDVSGQSGKAVYIAASKEDQYSASSSQWLFDQYPGPKIYKKYPGNNHGTDILDNVKDADRELIEWLAAQEE